MSKKKPKKSEEDEEPSEIEVDVHDERFASLFTDAEFAFDRTDQRFKPTNATRKIEEERRKRMFSRAEV